MTTDNRTNEPTPEQVEAAAKAIWERSAKIDDPFWDGGALDYGIKQIYRADARAALEASNAVVTKEAHDVGMDAVDWDMVRDGVGDPQEAASIAVRAALEAAQGAAPQAEAYDHCCNHPKCPGGSLCCCASEQRLRDCWNQWREAVAGDTKQAFRDAYSAGRNDPAPWAVAPVPSSGVDEDKLAEVIAKSRTVRGGGRR